MDVRFRIATSDDVEAIITLCNECFSEATDMDFAKKIFEETKDNPNDIYVIGEVDGNVVAHTKITIIKTIYNPMAIYSILNHVCVKPDYRRHGIATKMLDYITDICKEHGCNKIELWSNNVRTAAHACYYNYGFELDDAGFFSMKIEG